MVYNTQFIFVRMNGLESTSMIKLICVPPFMFVSLSKTATKQVLLDSLLQELCIKSAWHSLAFEFTQAECPVLSVANSRENN